LLIEGEGIDMSRAELRMLLTLQKSGRPLVHLVEPNPTPEKIRYGEDGWKDSSMADPHDHLMLLIRGLLMKVQNHSKC
jgi:hypothetical protein